MVERARSAGIATRYCLSPTLFSTLCKADLTIILLGVLVMGLENTLWQLDVDVK